MPNTFISQYESAKLLDEELITPIIHALNAIKTDREDWGYKAKHKAGDKVGWRGVFSGFFYEVDVTAKNMGIVTDMIRDLTLLQGTDKQDDPRAIIEILSEGARGLSAKGKTNELVMHIIKEIGSIKYNLRDSATITPQQMDVVMGKDHYTNQQTWKAQLQPILAKKNLPDDLFDPQPASAIQLSDNISEHVKWAFNNIYKVPYPNEHEGIEEGKEAGIHRYIHGIQHVTRAALYLPVFANLYRKHGDPEAVKLTADDLKLLQIAAVFHDSAREGEAEDLWDHESALLLYSYLTKTLNVDHQKAKQLAEAMANKDQSPNGYFEINENSKGEVEWRFSPDHPPKNIYQKLIHDADCLEIIRARDHFEARYLDFYQDIAVKPGNELALEEMAKLITEARSLIEIQGDSRHRTKADIKKKYENENAYTLARKDITADDHTILYQLGERLLPAKELQAMKLVDLTPYDPAKGLTAANILAAMQDSKAYVFVRGIGSPSALAKTDKGEETLAELEMRKFMRVLGEETRSTKADRAEKEGNPHRSVSMIGYGSGVFTNAGFILLQPAVADISEIYAVDSGTGRGKKTHLKGAVSASEEDKTKQLAALHHKLKTGGSSETFKGHYKAANHVEILYRIRGCHAIYFSHDPNLYNEDLFGRSEATHPHSPVLQAIYLQKAYESQYEQQYAKRKDKYETLHGVNARAEYDKKYGGKTLPIFEYSALHNKVIQRNYTQEEVIKMWREMCGDYMRKETNNVFGADIFGMDIDEIKTLSMYVSKTNQYAKENNTADRSYGADFFITDSDKQKRSLVSMAIEEERKIIKAEHIAKIREEISSGKTNVFSDRGFFNLVRNPELSHSLKAEIIAEIKREIKADLFGETTPRDFYDPKNLPFSRNISGDEPLGIQEVINSGNDGLIQTFFETKAMRIHALAKLLADEPDLKDMADKIKNVALDMANSAIEKLNEDLKDTGPSVGNFSFDQFMHTYAFINGFGLLPQLKANIDHLIEVMIPQAIIQAENSIASQEYGFKVYNVIGIFSYLEKHHLLKPEHVAQVDAVFSALENAIKTDTNFGRSGSDLKNYFQLAKLTQADQQNIQSSVSQFLSHATFLFTHENFSAAAVIAENIPLNDSNMEIFDKLLNHIAPSSYSAITVSLDDWVKTVIKLQTDTPNKQFSAEQIASLKINWEIKVALYIQQFNSLTTPKADFDVIADFNNLSRVITMLSTNIPIKINEEMARFFNQISEARINIIDSNKLLDQSEKEALLQIKALNELLPLKAERTKMMEKIDNLSKLTPVKSAMSVR